MKKVFIALFLAVILMSTPVPTYAANIQINIDGVVITSDVNPEIRHNRTMVPLRVISENLGATIHWSGSEVTLTKNDMQIVLKPQSNTAMKNGKMLLLDVKPYVKKDRLFVPLRFLAETFDCKVNYENSIVTVNTEPLFIGNVKVHAIEHEYRMTMGGVVQKINGSAYNKAIYDIFIENKGSKVEAPTNTTWHIHLDTPGSYYKVGQYDFMNLEGHSIQRYDIYTLVESFPADTLAEYPKVLIHDATENQWYLFTDNALQAINQLVNNASMNGFIKIISNTVV